VLFGLHHGAVLGTLQEISIGDPDPQDPHVFWVPGSISQRYGSGSGSCVIMYVHVSHALGGAMARAISTGRARSYVDVSNSY
jgi:hypothetical protein